MTITKAQRIALKKVFDRTDLKNYRVFRRTVVPGWDCIMVQFAGMFLGIERNGYTHS